MSEENPFNETPEAAKARRMRSIMMALALAGFVILVFITTLVKVKGHVFDPNF
jgi:hypothetical protein